MTSQKELHDGTSVWKGPPVDMLARVWIMNDQKMFLSDSTEGSVNLAVVHFNTFNNVHQAGEFFWSGFYW